MGRSFYIDEEEILNRIQVLLSLISEQKLHNTVCPLLNRQIRELEVLIDKLENELIKIKQKIAQ
jgi:hypothetical protein